MRHHGVRASAWPPPRQGAELGLGGVVDENVEAGGEGGELRISVRDFGPGVPEAQLEDIFRAFYRVDGSRSRQSGGVGLGLAIAREAAFRHGGRITARNALPGLEIIITLPCTPRCGI